MESNIPISPPKNLEELRKAKEKIDGVTREKALNLLEEIGISRNFVDFACRFYSYRYFHT